MLPEFRPSWWETGLRARANASVFGVFAELPGLTRRAVRVAWRADRLRTSMVAVATVGAGTMAAFGPPANNSIRIRWVASGPTPDRVRAALPALVWLAAVTAVRGGLGMLVGYALNGLTPRVHMLVERELFENTTAVELRAFDNDQFAEGMERATRGTEAAIGLVQTTMNLFAGLVGGGGALRRSHRSGPIRKGDLVQVSFPGVLPWPSSTGRGTRTRRHLRIRRGPVRCQKTAAGRAAGVAGRMAVAACR